MPESPILLFNSVKEKNSGKYNLDRSFTKVYETNLPGQGILHTRHSACEFEETFRQHGIMVHLKPEHNSLRRMGDRLERENVNVGDVVIVPANVNHWRKVETEVCEAICLTVEPQVISRIARETTDLKRVELLPTFAKSDPLIQHLALNIKANLDSKCYNRLYAESLFHTLSMHLFKNYSMCKFELKECIGGLPPYKLKQAIEYINDNLDRSIKITDIAKLIDISSYYFCRLFNESTGVSPYQYVIQQRVAKAKNLIKNSKSPLADISYECGFSSQSQMTQHFRKIVGVTPKVYRNRL